MDPTLTLLYFPSAFLLGALHAMEPGHAKALTAAYLIGIRGTVRDAVLLGLSAAATHSVVVVGLSVAALWLGREAFADRAMYWLQVGSGSVVIVLGLWLLWRRLRPVPRHHHGAEPVVIRSVLGRGELDIIDTAAGERMRFSAAVPDPSLNCRVDIARPGGAVESLPLLPVPGEPRSYLSGAAPAEPHEFAAVLVLERAGERETVGFEMHEPTGHQHGHDHDHDHMDDEEHARAHAATLPGYVHSGERPSAAQIVAFGAAGGMIPCPASVTVMLLALTVGQTGMGLLTVLGFSLGLAVTLVGLGMAVVVGVSRLGGDGRFAWLSRRAPVVSAAVVILSGIVSVALAR